MEVTGSKATGDVAGHGRELGFVLFLDIGGGNADFFSLWVGHDDDGTFATKNQPAKTLPSVIAKVVLRKAWSTLRSGSRVSSSNRSIPRMPTPSS